MGSTRRDLDPGQRLLRWLAQRDRSEQEIRQRLVQWGVEADRAAALLTDLVARGLVDDAALAGRLCDWHCRHDPLGPRGMLRRLAARGIAAEVADEAVAPLRDAQRQRELALRLVQKRLPQLLPLKPQRRLGRMATYLARRGFDDTVIRETIEPLGSEHPTAEDFD